MKPSKDIFDLFKDNQHKLNESPSRQAWERLESRLDQHKDRNRRTGYRILSMAAAVVALVAFVSVISFMLNTNRENWEAMQMSYEGFSTEELKVLSVSNEASNQLALYQKKYNDHLSSPIQEGNANKKLIAKMDIQRRDGNLNSFLQKARREQPQLQAIAQAPSIAETKINKMELSSANAGVAKESYAPELAEDAAYDSIISTGIAADEVAGFADDVVVGAAEQIEEAEAIPSKKAKRQTERASVEKKDQSADAKTLPQVNPSAAYDNANMSGIQQFQWLTGKWEGNVNNQISIENWKQTDHKTIEGSGFLMVNDQSIFQEKMKIQEIGGLIYFIADLNGTGNPIKYQLVSNDGFQAVFENHSVDFPNQVVLQRTNSSNFSTIYQNTEPGYINESQQNYYLNRNYIQKEQVIRNLRRVVD